MRGWSPNGKLEHCSRPFLSWVLEWRPLRQHDRGATDARDALGWNVRWRLSLRARHGQAAEASRLVSTRTSTTIPSFRAVVGSTTGRPLMFVIRMTASLWAPSRLAAAPENACWPALSRDESAECYRCTEDVHEVVMCHTLSAGSVAHRPTPAPSSRLRIVA